MLDILKNIGFDWQVALANLVNFLIIFWILRRFVFRPIQRILKERTEAIQSGIDNAQQSETELLITRQKTDQQLKEAKQQANQIIAEAQERADEQIAHAQQTAEQEATEIITKAKDNIIKEKKLMEKELFEKTAGLVALGVQKILDEEVNEERNAELNKRAVQALDQN